MGNKIITPLITSKNQKTPSKKRWILSILEKFCDIFGHCLHGPPEEKEKKLDPLKNSGIALNPPKDTENRFIPNKYSKLWKEGRSKSIPSIQSICVNARPRGFRILTIISYFFFMASRSPCIKTSLTLTDFICSLIILEDWPKHLLWTQRKM